MSQTTLIATPITTSRQAAATPRLFAACSLFELPFFSLFAASRRHSRHAIVLIADNTEWITAIRQLSPPGERMLLRACFSAAMSFITIVIFRRLIRQRRCFSLRCLFSFSQDFRLRPSPKTAFAARFPVLRRQITPIIFAAAFSSPPPPPRCAVDFSPAFFLPLSFSFSP